MDTILKPKPLSKHVNGKASHHFDEAHTIHELKHFLPSQQSLKDFIPLSESSCVFILAHIKN
ncbi:MAG: hypothetical protein E6H07_03560 [Bacteroidetes bacterium]|nr:MAG: hypothetical protein E6H07_03560 [Bacteroidota bacterium]